MKNIYEILKAFEIEIPEDKKEEIKEYLIKEPNLIKRPVVEANHQVIVGFKEEEYEEFKWQDFSLLSFF